MFLPMNIQVICFRKYLLVVCEVNEVLVLVNCMLYFPEKYKNIYFVILCRPLSKTVRFNVLKVIPAGSSGGGKKAFTGI